MRTIKEERQIILRRGTRKPLCKMFKCTESAMSMVLHFQINSLTARRIRSYAVNFMGATPFYI